MSLVFIARAGHDLHVSQNSERGSPATTYFANSVPSGGFGLIKEKNASMAAIERSLNGRTIE